MLVRADEGAGETRRQTKLSPAWVLAALQYIAEELIFLMHLDQERKLFFRHQH
jgi:hypothetical protein